jgi:hypothetical protein
MGKTIHGRTGTNTWMRWQHMRRRCNDPKHPSYIYYGGKGIEYCSRWEEFKNFLEDMGEVPDETYTLDRIDPGKNYEKENCRWATIEQQNGFGKSNLTMIKYLGRTQCLRSWARELGINFNSIYTRIRRGWSVEKTFLTPVTPKSKRDSLGRFK